MRLLLHIVGDKTENNFKIRNMWYAMYGMDV